ncbi:glutamate receptor ionotropic, kainate 2-like [Rhagoletis pomonella]|uniref:glutamate receptor ionotropic, kainate 2-like n=1 Tax=Rhagoletis pomonella TaxID=28610 RepID=UPI00177BC213|nr:glutamate receptor ionotropic, kainate 2-like [Rhagoletis pomonella]
MPHLHRPLLKQIKNSAEAHIVLDCSTDKIYEVLKQAQQIGMMSDYHSYLITSLDLHTINVDEFRYGGTNITGFRLINEKVVSDVVRQWSFDDKGLQRSANLSTVRAETALMYDAVHLFSKALHDLDTSQQIDIHPISCDGQNTWLWGITELEVKLPYNDYAGFEPTSMGGQRKLGAPTNKIEESSVCTRYEQLA